MSTDYILIVDDEPNNLNVAGTLLKELKYDLSFATNGQDALERIQQSKPSLVLLDVMMPGLDGYQVCEIIKNDEANKNIPILMLSGLTDEVDIARGLEIGADDFLSKPFRPLELKARVKNLLRTKNLFDELEAANKVTDNLVQMIAHDLRTPLTVVKCLSSLLKNKEDEKTKDYGQKIHLSSSRAENMINDMLCLSLIHISDPRDGLLSRMPSSA